MPTQLIRFDTGGDTIAALPHLVGYHPENSVIVVGLNDHGGEVPRVGLVQCASVPTPGDEADLALQLVTRAATTGAHRAFAVVLSAGDVTDPPHTHLIEALTQTGARAGVRIELALWAPDTRAGSPWGCYHSDYRGTVPDPQSSVLAAAAVAAGMVTYDSREALAAHLAPTDAVALLRRTVRLMARSESTPAQYYRVVAAAIRDAAGGVLPTRDQQVVALARALSDPLVRDAALGTAHSADADAAERLWTTLVRGLPAPHRAAPATLLALSAWQRGDGALASIALETALAANPEYPLARLLELTMGVMPPDELHAMIQEGSTAAIITLSVGT